MLINQSIGLADKLCAKPDDMLVACGIRGEIKCRANALPFIKPLKVADREIEITGLPGHFGYHGIATGRTANDITPNFGVTNVINPGIKIFYL